MELSFIIIGIIIAVIAFKTFQKRAKAREPETDADAELTFHKSSPVYPKQNDKIVLIEGADHSDMKNVVSGFCNMYNEKNYKTLPRLLKLSERDFAIIFPYDIDFEIYCYFINYLNYPIEIKWDARVTGWTTATPSEWIPEKCLNKKIMLFVADDDTEGDNVYMTTSENVGYKLGFAVGEEKHLLDHPKKKFRPPPIEIEELANKEFEDFK